MNWIRWLILGIIVAGAAALIIRGYRPKPVIVDAAVAERGSLQVSVEEEGVTRVTDRYMISAPVSGFAPRLDLDVGDRISAGQVILQLRPLPSPVLDDRSRAEAEAQTDAAEAKFGETRKRREAARADAAYWEAELGRMRKLLDSGDIAAAQYDRVLTEHRRSEAILESLGQAVGAAKAELEAARARLLHSASAGSGAGEERQTVTVRAPIAGRILKLVHESESIVQPGQSLVEIGDANALEVVVDVLSEYAVQIAPGTKVILTQWGGEKPLTARVRRVEPVGFTKVSALGVEEQRVLVIAGITSPKEEWDRLGSGYRVEASFILWEEEDVLEIPASAVFRRGDEWAVFTVEGGRARRRNIESGRRNSRAVQILAGLAEGDTVITHPDETIEDGSEVILREQ